MTTAFFTGKLSASNFEKNDEAADADRAVFGEKLSLLAKLFGCWHKDLSRPFAHGKTSYRSCLQCGARKRFNAETLETRGSFYFPPVLTR